MWRASRTALYKESRPAAVGMSGAGNETRTRDPNLGKVVRYQLRYIRVSGSLRALVQL